MIKINENKLIRVCVKNKLISVCVKKLIVWESKFISARVKKI